MEDLKEKLERRKRLFKRIWLYKIGVKILKSPYIMKDVFDMLPIEKIINM